MSINVSSYYYFLWPSHDGHASKQRGAAADVPEAHDRQRCNRGLSRIAKFTKIAMCAFSLCKCYRILRNLAEIREVLSRLYRHRILQLNNTSTEYSFWICLKHLSRSARFARNCSAPNRTCSLNSKSPEYCQFLPIYVWWNISKYAICRFKLQTFFNFAKFKFADSINL